MQRPNLASIAIALAFVMVTVTANAQQPAPARQHDQLARECQHWVSLHTEEGELPDSEIKASQAAACESYVRGMVDSFNMLRETGEDTPYSMCIPESRIGNIITDFVEMSKKPHPNRGMSPPNTVAYISLNWIMLAHSGCNNQEQ